MNTKKLFIIIFSIIPSFLFSQIPQDELILWLSADSVEIIDGKVARWYDRSENDYQILQNSATARPTFAIASELNNQPVIVFNGTNSYLDGGNILNLGTNSHTFFIISKKTGNSGSFFSKSRAATAEGRYGFIIESGNLSFFYHDNQQRNVSLNSFSNNNYNLFSILNNRQNQKNQLFVNSNFVKENSLNADYEFNNTFNFLIGAYNNSSGGVPPYFALYLNGAIAEIIFYNRLLTEQERSIVENYLMDKYTPELTLGPDIYVDYGFCDTTISIPAGFTDFQWSSGETTQSISVNQSGQYWASAKDYFGRTHYDTINVFFPTINIENSYIICAGDSILVNPGLTGTYFYEWSDGSTDSENYLKNAGSYWIRIEDTNSCFDTVFFDIQIDNFKNLISLGNDTTLCSGNKIRLIQGEELCTSFLWESNGNTLSEQAVYESGWQKLTVTNENNCTAVDSIFISIVGTAPEPDFITENLCFGSNTLFFDNSTST
ncbi:MAG TPA: hypothetical protein PLE86_11305, partial [Bacteroidales bacterium]|nr:hypothetical protein [Bacteroidales bacterium]